MKAVDRPLRKSVRLQLSRDLALARAVLWPYRAVLRAVHTVRCRVRYGGWAVRNGVRYCRYCVGQYGTEYVTGAGTQYDTEWASTERSTIRLLVDDSYKKDHLG